MEKDDQNANPPAKAKRPSRRRFVKEMAAAAGGAAMVSLGVGLYAEQASALPAVALRPPGALPEPEFLAACTRCGLCVRACPYDTLKLAELGDSIATGTPYFHARKIPCYMCEDIPCVPVCPSGALDRKLTNIEDARMGLAVLVDQETCLNYLGLRCDVCFRVCPLINKAITLELKHNPRSDRHAMMLPTVHSDYCTGCGICEKRCVLPEEGESAIKVMSHKLAQGTPSPHYRKGWEEKEKAGGSLIGDQLELPVRGLEDRKFGDPREIPTTPAPMRRTEPGGDHE